MLRNGVWTDPYEPLFPKGDWCARAKGLWVVRQQRGMMSNHMVKNIILLNVFFQNFECCQGGMLCVMPLTSFGITPTSLQWAAELQHPELS